MSDQKTIDFYNLNAASYGSIEPTPQGNFLACRKQFIELLRSGSKILDLGSGGGHASLAFLEAGFEVVALDGSRELAKIASQRTGLDVIVQNFDSLDFCTEFDGIWAAASLTHVPIIDLESVLHRVARALKGGGILYASFKYAESDWRDRDGRLFGAIDSHTLKTIITKVGLLPDTIELAEGRGYLNKKATWLWLVARKARRDIE